MFKVNHLFSVQHILVILFAIGYTIGLCFLLKNKSKKTQFITLFTLSIIGVCLFAFRWRVLFSGETLTAGTYGGLLPLELCNIGAFVLPFTVFFKKRFLFVFSFFVNLLGALLAFIIMPSSLHSINIYSLQFLDFLIIHTNLVAVPFAMIFCGWYTLRFKDSIFATSLFAILALIIFFINLFLKAVNWPGDHYNYMFVMGPKGFPILSQFWSILPVPFVYLLLFMPIFFGYCLLVTLPMVKKGERKAQLKEMLHSFKYFGFNGTVLATNAQPASATNAEQSAAEVPESQTDKVE